ncbi:protein of unknown function (DUF4219) [Popillia japonica]|uniref:Copia protein n=1 Tax=Popillia japonica TaxID=7064 RepID=A0AAW1KBA1_POPJA
MEDEKYKIPVFDGNNYSNWKFRVQTLLEAQDLSSYIEKEVDLTDEEIKKKDRKSFDVWETLKEIFERKGIKSQLLLRRKLLAMKYNENETLQNHLLVFDKMIKKLKNSGVKMEELDIISHLLLTLPKAFDQIITVFDTVEEKNLTLNFVKNKLLDNELKRKHTSHDSLKVGYKRIDCKYKKTEQCSSSKNVKPSSTSSSGNLTVSKRIDCKYKKTEQCSSSKNVKPSSTSSSGNLTVSKDEIVKPSSTSSSGNLTVSKDEISFIVQSRDDVKNKEITWCRDSGASEHMVNKEIYFKNLRHLKERIKIAVAKEGQMLDAVGIGDIEVMSDVELPKEHLGKY